MLKKILARPSPAVFFPYKINQLRDHILTCSQLDFFGINVAVFLKPETKAPKQLPEWKGTILEGNVFFTLSGLSLVGILSMLWLWRS